MRPSQIGLFGGGASRSVVISADQTNYNLFTALGSPTTPLRVYVTINSGVVVRSNSTGTPAFDEGALPAGSRVYITNNGKIHGMGGAGGAGGTADYVFGSGYPGTVSTTAGVAGGAGGTALRLTAPTVISNASGEVFGGGGGGGGGNGSACWFNADSLYIIATQANGGGGGQGANTSSGGAIGATPTYTDFSVTGQSAGTSGNSSGAGVGGAAFDGGISFGAVGLTVGKAGDGGGWGAAGQAGESTTYLPTVTPGNEGWYAAYLASVGAGGAAGKAVDLNGQSITWVSGNDSTHVKGAVS